MIKNVFIIICFLIFFHGVAEARGKIVAIQSIRVAPYEKVIQGVKSVCNSKINRLVVSELEGADVVEKITKIKPDMILAIGMNALSMVKEINNIPIIYLMILNPQSILSGEKNITGVSLNVPQDKQLDILSNILPDFKNIGLLYDPERTGNLVKRAQIAAQKTDINLIAEEVHSSKDVPVLLKTIKGKCDILWMLPDITVITPETIESLLLFSIENKIPILTFSEKYVEVGATMSIGVDAYDMGCQAGEMAKKILAGTDVTRVQQEDARKTIVSINLKIAKKLGIHIDKKNIGDAVIVN